MKSGEGKIEPIIGRYINVDFKGSSYRIYYEEAGEGIPLCCLHTAGSDSRQYHDLLLDEDVTKEFRVLAFDLPSHGKSDPIPGWLDRPYRLTSEFYTGIIVEFCRSLDLKKPVVMGCSMGGAVVLELALLYPDFFDAVIGLEASDHSSGKLIKFLNHPRINSSEFIPLYISGLISPDAPRENREKILWHYSQSGLGVFEGDLFYYYNIDNRDKVGKIDTSKCKVYLLTGEYDYSCTPEMTEETARKIKGSHLRIMKGLGHFPMAENYPVFKKYLMPILEDIKKRRSF
jgi:pimeloyl-ACP methyl ester carboxylesterase